MNKIGRNCRILFFSLLRRSLSPFLFPRNFSSSVDILSQHGPDCGCSRTHFSLFFSLLFSKIICVLYAAAAAVCISRYIKCVVAPMLCYVPFWNHLGLLPEWRWRLTRIMCVSVCVCVCEWANVRVYIIIFIYSNAKDNIPQNLSRSADVHSENTQDIWN